MGKSSLSAYTAIKFRLLDMFRSETFPDNKLPSEAELSKRLSISLVTLRESLSMLALEGYITKRHGVGNFVHPSALDSRDRMDLGYSFADVFRQNGHKPGLEILRLWSEPAGEELADLLHIASTDPVQCNEMLYTSDGAPGVLTLSRLPEGIITKPFRQEENTWYIYESVWDHCQRQLAHSLNHYKAMIAPERVAKLFQVVPGTALMYSQQIFYDVQDYPIMLNVHYFHPDHYGMRMLQNWDMNATR